MSNILRFPDQSPTPPQSIAAPNDADKLVADLVDGAGRLVGESQRYREQVMRAVELLVATERRVALVEDDETRSALLGLLADKRKCLALLDQTLAAELQSFCSLTNEIQCDEAAEASLDPAKRERTGGPIAAAAAAK